ncbi:MAG: hypothetical protein KDJ22_03090 [Candidatus Competibacteraceae bacterium]|nr:hypothetical protein [Candidatus Competibacteraceae bacterium]MCP5124834.1 hypothetical protein [Gammaproteobacteria bacterium]
MHSALILGIFLGAMSWMSPAPASKSAPEEFIVPLQATTSRSTLRNSGRVRLVKKDELTGKPAFQAKNAQTAIIAAINQKTSGCWMIRYGTDFGWVAASNIHYSASDNPVTLRRSQQEARFKAFTDARTQLAGCLRALSPEARRAVAKRLEQDSSIQLALINLATNDAEKWEQALRILARGFVAYSVEEDTAKHSHSIQVNLVTTLKTATQLTRPAANAIEATSIQEGLAQLLAEIQAGLIPPVGNRLIVVNASGELTLVGYAINLIGVHPNAAAQDKLRVDAEKIATARATEAIIGLAIGDDTRWQHNLDEISQREVRTAASGYDDNEPSANRFRQIRDLVMASAKDDPGLQTLVEGNLPSSAAIKRFGEEDRVAVAVIYTPTVRKPAPPPPPPATPVVEPANDSPVMPSVTEPSPGSSPPPPVPPAAESSTTIPPVIESSEPTETR